METLYDVLNVERDATSQDLRQAYLAAARSLHPDKVGENGKRYAEEGFKKLQAAWQVLCDDEKRKAYDRQLNLLLSSSTMPIQETLGLDEMDEQGNGDSFSYPCRCGDFFMIDGEDVLKCKLALLANLILPCRSCSLHVEVVLSG
ncbi:hypothetical protein BSKO_12834 [Bryopsis sp. KO-2023]|nr:hypothetical protein BSKO_12834 [Bryopsis sp. KO-2023]